MDKTASYGTLFLLAMFGPVYYAGSNLLNVMTKDSGWPVVVSLFGAAGVGALLYLTGQALWEFLTPYGSKSGLRVLAPRLHDFREALARGEFSQPEEPIFNAARTRIREDIDAGKTQPWWPGHEGVISTEFSFYRDAPESLVEWCRRRYGRFVEAITASAAIVLGVMIGWYFLTPYADLGNLLRFDAVLLLVVILTVAWATEIRHQAQEMERLWFAVQGTYPTPDPKLQVKFDTSTPIAIQTDGREAPQTDSVLVEAREIVRARVNR